jgi:ketosteroid isomerase-like protein
MGEGSHARRPAVVKFHVSTVAVLNRPQPNAPWRTRAITAVASVSLLLGCSHAPVATFDARAIVDERGAVFSAAVLEASASNWDVANVERLVALYTDDATLFPPDGPPVMGKEAMSRYWTRTPDRRILKHRVTPAHAEHSGALLYEYGTFTGTFESRGVSSESTARYISVWRKDADGTWRKHMDTWW